MIVHVYEPEIKVGERARERERGSERKLFIEAIAYRYVVTAQKE